jgi:hypothetical protein
MWLEDEPHKKEPYLMRLQKDRHYVRITERVTEAEQLLVSNDWHVLIVDLLIPYSAAEASRYGHGPYIGLHFLKTHRVLMASKRCCPVIFTSYPDHRPHKLAASLGLGAVPYITSQEIDDSPQQFVTRVYEGLARCEHRR